MILMHRVALGGVQLDSIDSRIMVKGVATQAASEKPGTAQKATDGLRYNGTKRESLDVTVRIGLRIYDDEMDEREELMEAVNAWAKKLPGWITTTQKPGRRFWAEAVRTPAPGDPAEWTNEFTYTFTAYALPWWEKDTATSQALTQSSTGEGTLTMPGSTDTVAEVLVQNKSGETINDLVLTVNDTQMTFTGLGLANNGYFTLDHQLVKGVYALRARIGDTSKLNCMSGDDELIMHPGANEISYSAGGAVIATFSARGRYQ